MKYPVGIQAFDKIRQDGYVYVDKTDLVYRLVTEGTVYFLSRPRRFGKSLLLSTLENYFLGRKELFRGLKIDALEKDWTEYPVFVISFAKGEYSQPNMLEKNLENFLKQAEQQYGIVPDVDEMSIRFYSLLEAAHKKTGRQAVVLIDEYDKPLLDVMGLDEYVTDAYGNRKRLEEYNRNILKGFYGVFKDADKHLKFVMLTGVTKFSQITVFSGFNQPEDISMVADYETLCGISKEEMLTVFDEPIRELAKKMKLSYDETVATLKQQYDGYHFGEEMTDMYNPFSLLNCFKYKSIKDYWFRTATPTYLVRLLHSCNQNINELVGRYYAAEYFVDYRATAQKPLPMIYQSGYLTIKAYDDYNDKYLLDFPNEEVRKGFIGALSDDYFQEADADLPSIADEARAALEDGRVEEFINLITGFMASLPHHLLRKQDAKECERHFQTAFYLIIGMVLRRNTMMAERSTSQGRIDCVIGCPRHIYILEFKLNGSARAALEQIKDKDYAAPYAADTRTLHKVGVNFSSEKGTIDEWCAE